jgi:TRAP-type C4-dicarboxylate transport system substrate-binding protein
METFDNIYQICRRIKMKKYLAIAASVVFLAMALPAWAGDVQVKKVDKEKFDKLTPEQKEKFKQTGKEAQRAGEASVKQYNEVEKEATEAKGKAEQIRDGAIKVEKKFIGIE